MDTLFSNVTCVTMNEAMDVLFSAFVGVEGGKIAYIGKTPPKEPPKTIIDGTGMVLLPGLINCHIHLNDSLFSFYADGWKEEERQWLQSRREAMDSRSAKAAALLTLARCMRYGVTSVSSLDWFTDEAAQAVAESGMKANLARPARGYDPGDDGYDMENDMAFLELRRLHETWHGHDGRIRVDAGFESPLSSMPEQWEALGGYAKTENLGVQLHLSRDAEEEEEILDRTGLTPAELMACHGALWAPATVEGLFQPEADELRTLAKNKATYVVCSTARRNQGSEAPKPMDLAKAGINVALGSGSPASASCDLFRMMERICYEAKADGQADAMPAAAALMMATVCGAKAQGRASECGMIKVGYDADLILVDFTTTPFLPCHNVMTSLVHEATGSDVVLTMVKGKTLYQGGRYLTIDLDKVVQELTQHAMNQVFTEEPTE